MAVVLAIVIAIVSAVVGSVLTWYLQRRWTPDPTIEVAGLRKDVAAIREQFSDFKLSVESKERERIEFEEFPFRMSIQQGTPGNYVGNARNDTPHQVCIETIQILRGDTDHKSPLTEQVKPRVRDRTIAPGGSKNIDWAPQSDPVAMLKSLVRSTDPNFPNGRVIPIILELNVRVDGKRLIPKKYVQQVLFQGSQILPWGPS